MRELLDLLASMRFAVSLLTVICIASVIGTVVKQREPLNNYVNQFGPFWSEVFGKLDLYTVYGAWWFLLILGFLVTSTSLCILRNTPKIIQDLRNYKEHVREQSLQSFHHKALGHMAGGTEAALAQVSSLLSGAGWKAKIQVRDRGVMVAARKGAANKVGYLAAHSAIVLVCLGGLLDGDLLLRGLMWAQNKSVYEGGGLISEVTADHRLPPGNPSFRGNLMVPEGGRAATAILSMPTGVVLQDLPFDVELKKFIVEYYDTGMPKLFASDVIIRDHDTGKLTEAKIKVNEPLIHQGVALYQSSFDDGGSELKLLAYPLQGGGKPVALQGRVGNTVTLKTGPNDKDALTLELGSLRVINVENMSSNSGADTSTDVRRVDLVDTLGKHLGSGARNPNDKALHNIGPSFSYKLIDAAGQRREFNNYMSPVTLEGQSVFLVGVRENLNDGFRYLRIPADDRASMQSWLNLRAALLDTPRRERAARRYAEMATPADKPQMLPQLQATAARALGLFAGVEKTKPKVGSAGAADVAASGSSAASAGAGASTATATAELQGGLPALSNFIETEVPAAEQQRVSEVLLRILNGSLFELYKISREQAGQTPPATDAQTQTFMTQSVLALSDSMFYPSPVLVQLDEFKQVQASVFQVTRAPGQKLVYLGAILLIIGVLAMLYIKERRLWVWLESAPGQIDTTRVRMALSCTRESPDVATEFEQLKAALLKEESV
ncbi:cytochrome c biogenesis protein ResB [Paucibacter sp. hw1]|uniref:Cytochrome c biogenesis protein ResB n=2 Tax=Roseateles koreensis TaxID=2987526 RepID=A0ABT5KPF3_9BURK|nr:cytochrome c biogenesis protein ResB [Roseateles koreensis]MDC8784789.1 cytochrome c biogenesis protein ResB [Roseateles koreensis]